MNHPTQGLEDMTLDLSTYSEAELSALQTRIEEEKAKRERKVPFEVNYYDPTSVELVSVNNNVIINLRHRLSAEAKLRAAGGGSFEPKYSECHLFKKIGGGVAAVCNVTGFQGVIYFQSEKQALSAYATLTPDEQAAIFGFGEG